jgi:methyltransferase (TIGR00027 family)
LEQYSNEHKRYNKFLENFAMKDNNASITAEIVAAMRAYHSLFEQPKVFDDPFAFGFCNKRWQRILKSRIRRRIVFNFLMREARPVALEVLGRARYTEDLLDQAIANGVTQYVILGAGYDSFTLRRPDLADRLEVFEIDFPATQAAKRQKMLSSYGALPPNLNFVGVNFEQESLADGLARSTYKADQKTFFSWLGVTMYLTRETSMATLQSIADNSPAGSEIVFDYIVSGALKKVMAKPRSQKISKMVSKLGEPFIGFFEHAEMAQTLNSVGMELIEDLSPDEQQARYHQGRKDRIKTISRAYFAHAKVS